MAVSGNLSRALRNAIGDPGATKELVKILNAVEVPDAPKTAEGGTAASAQVKAKEEQPKPRSYVQ